MSSALVGSEDRGKISIVSATELANLSDITILDCRPAATFRQGRIPASQHVDWKDWSRERADVFGFWFGKGALAGLVRPPGDELQNQLRKLGISNSKKVVVVGEPGHWGDDGRIAWDLLYWGHHEVALLDGGFPAWLKAFPQSIETGDISIPQKGDFSFHVRPDRRADLNDVKTTLQNKSRFLVDNRSIEEFNGKKLTGQKRGGHLPGAVSVPVEMLYQQDGSFIDKKSLENLVILKKESTPIAYCAGGVRSALFAMIWEARTGELISNYDGSIWEWSAKPELPLE